MTAAVVGILLGAKPPALDLDFVAGGLDSRITFSRASTATDGLYTDAAGSSYNTYLTNIPVLTSRGLQLVTEARTNFLLNSAVPATQTTASLSTGTYVFWCIGTGSVTSSAGTATASGLGAITGSQGTYQTIVVTVAGTLTFTVTGSIDRFQLELGATPSPFIETTGTTATRAQDFASIATSTFGYNAAHGTMYLKFILGSAKAGMAIVAMNAASRFFTTSDTSTSATFINSYDGTTQTDTTANVPLNVANTAISAWAIGSPWSITANGQAVKHGGANWSPTNFNATSIGIGAQNNGANGAGIVWIQQIKYYSVKKPDQFLVSRSAP